MYRNLSLDLVSGPLKSVGRFASGLTNAGIARCWSKTVGSNEPLVAAVAARPGGKS